MHAFATLHLTVTRLPPLLRVDGAGEAGSLAETELARPPPRVVGWLLAHPEP